MVRVATKCRFHPQKHKQYLIFLRVKKAVDNDRTLVYIASQGEKLAFLPRALKEARAEDLSVTMNAWSSVDVCKRNGTRHNRSSKSEIGVLAPVGGRMTDCGGKPT